MNKQLPEGMQNCTILFKECEKGHGWLTATNWVPFDCPTCERDKLRLMIQDLIDNGHVHIKTLKCWSSLLEEVQVPGDIALAIQTNRPQLLALAKRPMDAEEVGMLLNLMRVLMNTNQALREHSVLVSQRAEQVKGSLIGLNATLRKLDDFAAFRAGEDE